MIPCMLPDCEENCDHSLDPIDLGAGATYMPPGTFTGIVIEGTFDYGIILPVNYWAYDSPVTPGFWERGGGSITQTFTST